MQHLGLFLIFILSLPSWAQDERYYRQILNGELPKLTEEAKDIYEHQFNVKGASYSVDLNGDQFNEIIQPQKRDGVDWIEIRDNSQRKVFEAKLLAMGSESSLYKIKLAQISEKTKVMVLFLDEGKTAGRRFESTGRIFLISYDDNDFSTMRLTQGPHFFHEKEGQRDQYWRKSYDVEIRDLDKNGVREVIVEFNHIQRIMRYLGKGEWERL